ncbi:Arm DNA-binding domain-containing protein [Novosphingobium barchaimii]
MQRRHLQPAQKACRCSDGRGLHLEIHPAGSKLWRFTYRFDGKQKRLALGR